MQLEPIHYAFIVLAVLSACTILFLVYLYDQKGKDYKHTPGPFDTKPSKRRYEMPEKRVLDTVKKKFPDPRVCPICGNNKHTTGHIFLMREYRGDMWVFGGRSAAVVPVVCNECGRTDFFNAMILGLVDPDTGLQTKKDCEGSK